MEQNETDQLEVEQPTTYVAMFEQYVASLSSPTPADQPLIFHVRMLCQQLDKMLGAKGAVDAASNGAYLQAVDRLHKRLTPATAAPSPAAQQVPGQTDIFEFQED